MSQNKQATILTFALLITLLLVGSGIWWLRDNVFLKTLSNRNTLQSNHQLHTYLLSLDRGKSFFLKESSETNLSAISFLKSIHAPIITYRVTTH